MKESGIVLSLASMLRLDYDEALKFCEIAFALNKDFDSYDEVFTWAVLNKDKEHKRMINKIISAAKSIEIPYKVKVPFYGKCLGCFMTPLFIIIMIAAIMSPDLDITQKIISTYVLIFAIVVVNRSIKSDIGKKVVDDYELRRRILEAAIAIRRTT